ncbi:hypothetical protein AB1Y20_014430 [Prymnesium parvum]|uniref:Metalloendopeptidase n=1 Tax=Prymnesium parvum TaxID=97485 RepID=A0AB34IG73_PRYPA
MAVATVACWLFSAAATGWVTTSQLQRDAAAVPLQTFKTRRGAINRLWSSPLSSTSTHGLGNGINYAWNPVVCQKTLEPAFAENGMWGINFADCEAILASMRRAFKSWSDNHPKLKFFDITSDCELDRKARGLPPGTRCDSAEIWVTTTRNTSGADAAATTVVSYSWAADFVHTNGQPASFGVWEAVRAEIGFNSESICWYLDATFCGGFHSLKASMGVEDSILFIRCLIFGIWGLAMAEVLWHFFKYLRKQCKMCELSSATDKGADKALTQDAAMEFYYQLEKMAHINYSGLVMRIILLTVPLLFYEEIVLPCWECYDFEAAATHEIGHVLGLEHPDAGARVGQNYFYNRSFGEGYTFSETDLVGRGIDAFAVNCTNPTEQVELRSNSTEIDDTIMRVFTFNNPSNCIFQDDLDAINVLYPVCEDQQRVPLCIKDAQYLGLVRSSVYVLLPLVIGLSLVICTNEFAKRLQARRRRRVAQKYSERISAFEKSQCAKEQYKKAYHSRSKKKGKAAQELLSLYLTGLVGGTEVNLLPVRRSGPLEGLTGQECIRAAGAQWKKRALDPSRKGGSRNAVRPASPPPAAKPPPQQQIAPPPAATPPPPQQKAPPPLPPPAAAAGWSHERSPRGALPPLRHVPSFNPAPPLHPAPAFHAAPLAPHLHAAPLAEAGAKQTPQLYDAARYGALCGASQGGGMTQPPPAWRPPPQPPPHAAG